MNLIGFGNWCNCCNLLQNELCAFITWVSFYLCGLFDWINCGWCGINNWNNVKIQRLKRKKKQCDSNAIKSNVRCPFFFCSLWFKQQSAVRLFFRFHLILRIKWIVLSNGISYHSKTISKHWAPEAKRREWKNNDTENGKMFCQQQKRIGTNENEETQTHITVVKTRDRQQKKRAVMAWTDRAKRNNGSNNVNLLLHRFSCRQTRDVKNRKVERFSSFYVITLRLLTLFSLSLCLPLGSFFRSFVSFFFCFEISIFVVRYAHSLWSFCSYLLLVWPFYEQRFSMEMVIVVVLVAVFTAVSHFHWTPLLKRTDIWQFKL